jgi:hypothetical protein
MEPLTFDSRDQRETWPRLSINRVESAGCAVSNSNSGIFCCVKHWNIKPNAVLKLELWVSLEENVKQALKDTQIEITHNLEVHVVF